MFGFVHVFHIILVSVGMAIIEINMQVISMWLNLCICVANSGSTYTT